MSDRTIALRYGVDIQWTAGDYVEDVDGDLATHSGRDVVQAAIVKRMTSNGLPWDPNYGARARHYVDAPGIAAAPLVGDFLAQAQADDRVSSAKASVSIADDGSVSFPMLVQLVADTDPIQVAVGLAS